MRTAADLGALPLQRQVARLAPRRRRAAPPAPRRPASPPARADGGAASRRAPGSALGVEADVGRAVGEGRGDHRRGHVGARVGVDRAAGAERAELDRGAQLPRRPRRRTGRGGPGWPSTNGSMVNSRSARDVATARVGPAMVATGAERGRTSRPHHPLQIGRAVDAVAAGRVERLVQPGQRVRNVVFQSLSNCRVPGPPRGAAERGVDRADTPLMLSIWLLQVPAEAASCSGLAPYMLIVSPRSMPRWSISDVRPPEGGGTRRAETATCSRRATGAAAPTLSGRNGAAASELVSSSRSTQRISTTSPSANGTGRRARPGSSAEQRRRRRRRSARARPAAARRRRATPISSPSSRTRRVVVRLAGATTPPTAMSHQPATCPWPRCGGGPAVGRRW